VSAAPPSFDHAVRRVVLLTLGLNLLVAAVKGAYAAYSGSLAVASDAIHSVLDGSSNLVGLIALRLAAHPADDRHPYGHRKIEILAAAGIGLSIAGATIAFAWRATAALLADAAHTASDVLVTLGVLASLVAVRAGVPWADPVAALGVTVVIGRVALRIIGDNLDILLDRAALPAEEVRQVALATPGVLAAHRVRSRGAPGHYLLDLHIHVDGALSLTAAHALSHAVEARLRERFSGLDDVTIHVEPAGDAEDE
jgi:divalent metal cation (Fe/Co/Zn/Cd) transporter